MPALLFAIHHVTEPGIKKRRLMCNCKELNIDILLVVNGVQYKDSKNIVKNESDTPAELSAQQNYVPTFMDLKSETIRVRKSNKKTYNIIL